MSLTEVLYNLGSGRQFAT